MRRRQLRPRVSPDVVDDTLAADAAMSAGDDVVVPEGGSRPRLPDRQIGQPGLTDLRKKPRCKYCLDDNVYWVRENGRWQLFDKRHELPHRCDARKSATATAGLLDEPTVAAPSPLRERWVIEFYEPDEDPDKDHWFARRFAPSIDACDRWIEHARGIQAKIVVRYEWAQIFCPEQERGNDADFDT